jgi:hypothetical protein
VAVTVADVAAATAAGERQRSIFTRRGSTATTCATQVPVVEHELEEA